jgi:membrane-associated phospholipid phosphatase
LHLARLVSARAHAGTGLLRCRIVAALVSAAVLVTVRPTRAEDAPAPRPRVEWSASWRRFAPWEYAGTAAVGAVSLDLYYFERPPAQARWQGDNAFDDTIRGWLRADTVGGRAEAVAASDVLWLAGTAMPFVVDLPVALLVHRQPRLTWELLMMDLEANAVAGFINNASFIFVGRGRPDHRECAADPRYDPLCGIGNNASFPSGHTLGIATGAGLACVHHRYLPLYGNRAADAGVCALMIAGTVATAMTRVMADRHYTSDTLVGAAIGFGSGYGLPWLLHYRAGSSGSGAASATPGPVLVPFAAEGKVGIGLIGFL